MAVSGFNNNPNAGLSALAGFYSDPYLGGYYYHSALDTNLIDLSLCSPSTAVNASYLAQHPFSFWINQTVPHTSFPNGIVIGNTLASYQLWQCSMVTFVYWWANGFIMPMFQNESDFTYRNVSITGGSETFLQAYCLYQTPGYSYASFQSITDGSQGSRVIISVPNQTFKNINGTNILISGTGIAQPGYYICETPWESCESLGAHEFGGLWQTVIECVNWSSVKWCSGLTNFVSETCDKISF